MPHKAGWSNVIATRYQAFSLPYLASLLGRARSNPEGLPLRGCGEDASQVCFGG